MQTQLSSAQTGLHEECGVFGVYDLDGNRVAPSIYYGLCALQHRGQESCGIALTDTKATLGNIQVHKGLGLVNEVFRDSSTLKALRGDLGVGHVRYSTTGASVAENAQPLVRNYQKGILLLAHNGNLVNTDSLRAALEETGTVFHSTTDSEVLACLIAQARIHTPRIEDAIIQTAQKIRGAYGLVIASPRKLIGVRDPYGLKPLCLGRRGNAWILASESCALDSVGAQFIRDLLPGEILTITQEGLHSDTSLSIPREQQAHCIFEYIYFARLDSTLDGINVYDSRLRAGAALAKAYPVEADLVAGVPDSGVPHAIGFANRSGKPFARPFVKYTPTWPRSFMPTSQEARNQVAKMKQIPVPELIEGKKLLFVDDSIVRGTTSRQIVVLLREAGAVQVHLRISAPPFITPCYFGTDIPDSEHLIAHDRSPEEICALTGADSLGFLPLKVLHQIAPDAGCGFCDGCFTGNYPIRL